MYTACKVMTGGYHLAGHQNDKALLRFYILYALSAHAAANEQHTTET